MPPKAMKSDEDFRNAICQINDKLPDHVRPWWVSPAVFIFLITLVFGGGQVYSTIGDILKTVHEHVEYDVSRGAETISAMQAISNKLALTDTEIQLLKAHTADRFTKTEAEAHFKEDDLRDKHLQRQIDRMKK